MNTNYEKYLPIGTVVMLKGGTKRAMIIGFCSIADGKKDKIYDYTGCLYPEGVISSDRTLLFDHSQIEKIYHLGLIDDDERKFKSRLKEMINTLTQNK